MVFSAYSDSACPAMIISAHPGIPGEVLQEPQDRWQPLEQLGWFKWFEEPTRAAQLEHSCLNPIEIESRIDIQI